MIIQFKCAAFNIIKKFHEIQYLFSLMRRVCFITFPHSSLFHGYSL